MLIKIFGTKNADFHILKERNDDDDDDDDDDDETLTIKSRIFNKRNYNGVLLYIQIEHKWIIHFSFGMHY